jgi:CubicO group peptidase (beta-lactamase class C family)
MTLGEIVSKVAGRPINEFARDELFKPLGMVDSGYLPPDSLKPRCAPTEKRNGHWMIGEVHDPRAYALGGVAGHAGLFSTARDVARYCRMILGKGELEGVRVLKESTAEAMTTPHALPDGTGVRTYGFDVDTSYSSPRGDRFPKGQSFGHTGFTGTSLWIDPVHDAFVILLTNSVHPDGKGKVIKLRKEVGTAVAEAMLSKEG